MNVIEESKLRVASILMDAFPTVMVPKYGELFPCPTGKARFLMGRRGLFLEAVKPWGRIVTQLWECPRTQPLPYGEVEEQYSDFFKVLDAIEPIMRQEVIPRAAEYAKRDLEWAGWIVFDGEGLRFLSVDFEAWRAKAKVQYPVLEKGWSLAVDIHSHGMIKAFFSSEDNEDDAGGVKICIVLGDYENRDGKPFFKSKTRFAVQGFFVDVKQETEGWFQS